MGGGHLRRSGCTPSRIRPSVRIGTPSHGGRLLDAVGWGENDGKKGELWSYCKTTDICIRTPLGRRM